MFLKSHLSTVKQATPQQWGLQLGPRSHTNASSESATATGCTRSRRSNHRAASNRSNAASPPRVRAALTVPTPLTQLRAPADASLTPTVPNRSLRPPDLDPTALETQTPRATVRGDHRRRREMPRPFTSLNESERPEPEPSAMPRARGRCPRASGGDRASEATVPLSGRDRDSGTGHEVGRGRADRGPRRACDGVRVHASIHP